MTRAGVVDALLMLILLIFVAFVAVSPLARAILTDMATGK